MFFGNSHFDWLEGSEGQKGTGTFCPLCFDRYENLGLRFSVW